MTLLVNKINKNVLKQLLKEENFKRKTISFYRYVYIPNPIDVRNELFKILTDLNCFGRIYLAHEGINAQMSLPENNWDKFIKQLNDLPYFKDISIKLASLIAPTDPRLNASGFKKAEIATKTADSPTKL